MPRDAICTIISKNYLPYARVFAESFREFNRADVYVLLVDRVDGYFDPEAEPFALIEIEELRKRIPDFSTFCFQYSILELNTAVKPFFLEYLLEERDVDRLIYCDPDILFTNSLRELFGMLESASFVLTPHLTAPIPEDDRRPNELDILVAGTYNLGFLGLARNADVRAHLAWWKARLQDRCVVAVDKGLFVDQKWIDLLPGFYDSVRILRQPGYNVAYWNYHCRSVRLDNGRILVNGEPAYFFHFSGVSPEEETHVSKHQTRFHLEDLGDLGHVLHAYRRRVLAHGWEETKHWPYHFGRFDNGVRIPDVARHILLGMGARREQFSSPFDTTSDDNFFHWLNAPIDRLQPPVTRLAHAVYHTRPDVQRAYPDYRNSGYARFAHWFATSGQREHELDDVFVEWARPAQAATPVPAQPLRKLEHRMGRWLERQPAKLRRSLRKRRDTVMRMWPWRAVRGAWTPGAGSHNGQPHARRRRGRRPSGVNVAGYITSESGTGQAVRATIGALRTTDLPIALLNLESFSRQKDATYNDFTNDNPYACNLVHVNADQVPVFAAHQGPAFFEGRYNIGYWCWELSEFPHEWVDHLRYFDEIWTLSTFCAGAIGKVSPVPVIPMPLAIDLGDLAPATRAGYGLPEDAYIFFTAFDFLSVYDRKNPDAVPQAFRRAFTEDDRAMLVIKHVNGDADPAGVARLRAACDGLPVRFVGNYLDKADLYALMNLADCCVSLHRSEGFGIILADAMYLGKPVIATGYSGNMDFMTLNNSYPVKSTLVEIPRDAGPYRKGNVWAEPNLDHAAHLMRTVYEDPDAAVAVGVQAARDVRTTLSPQVIGQRLRARLQCAVGMSPAGAHV